MFIMYLHHNLLFFYLIKLLLVFEATNTVEYSIKSTISANNKNFQQEQQQTMSSAREKELAELEIRIRDLSTNQLSSVVDGPKESAETSPIIPPNINALRDLEMHARSISSNIDMALRDLRGSLRGMSDLTLESIQAFSSSINSSCDTVDAAIRSTYSVMAKAEEFSSCMGNVRKLTEQIKNMKNLVDLFENQLLTSESSNKAGSST